MPPILATRAALHVPAPMADELRWQALVGGLRRTMGDAPFDGAWGEAQQWQIDEAIRHALATQEERATA